MSGNDTRVEERAFRERQGEVRRGIIITLCWPRSKLTHMLVSHFSLSGCRPSLDGRSTPRSTTLFDIWHHQVSLANYRPTTITAFGYLWVSCEQRSIDRYLSQNSNSIRVTRMNLFDFFFFFFFFFLFESSREREGIIILRLFPFDDLIESRQRIVHFTLLSTY